MFSASGLVRRSRVFAGNMREPLTLAETPDALDAPVVMDRGIAT